MKTVAGTPGSHSFRRFQPLNLHLNPGVPNHCDAIGSWACFRHSGKGAAVARSLGFLYASYMHEIPLFPDFLLDTSRQATVPMKRSQIPWRTGAENDAEGNVWVSVFQTNAIVVRGRSRYKGRVLAALAIVKDAHRKSDRQAMEEAEESIRYRIAEAVNRTPPPERGRAYFYEKPKARCRCNDLIG